MTGTRTALVFPGQGSQHRKMLEAAPHNDAFDRLLDAAEALTDLELRQIVTYADDEDIADTRVAQPLLYLVDWAWGVALLEAGIIPVAVAGHSLGELAALAISGTVSVEAGLELVVERSKLMGATVAATPGGMAAVLGLEARIIEETCSALGGVWVANDNSDTQVVISGTHEGIEAATRQLSEAGARRVIPLKVSGPFHSPLMQPARDAFERIVTNTQFRDATIPVIQNTEPTPATEAETIRQRLIGQITQPVRWSETMRALSSSGPITVVEAGPGAVLTGLARGLDEVTAIAAETTGVAELIEEVSS
jgi:[acyl-carrier-protein] S-malonyltransferase